MSVPHFPPSAPAAEIAAALAESGVAVVDRLVPPAVLDRIHDEVAPWIDATAFGPDDFAGRKTRRTGGLVARSPACRELVMHPVVLDTVRALLADATSFQLHLTQVISIDPGEPAQMP